MCQYGEICGTLWKLQLNDVPLHYQPENSVVFGFRCGFLGLLHLEIIQECLEWNWDLHGAQRHSQGTQNGEVIDSTNPTNLPDPPKSVYGRTDVQMRKSW